MANGLYDLFTHDNVLLGVLIDGDKFSIVYYITLYHILF